MIPVTCMEGKKVALFGLGGSGLVTAQALVAGGADVTAYDDNPARVAEAQEKTITTGDLREIDWTAQDALVLSPGVPLTHPEPHWSVALAVSAKVPIIGDIELFSRQRAAISPSAPFIAITGTNGKSTTTALIAHILSSAGRNVAMGGNIGVPVLALDAPASDVIHVVECSSYQIDLAPSLKPTTGLLLNLSADHLDRHGTMENYAAIKARLVAGADHAVIGVDDQWCRAIAGQIEGCTTLSVARDRGLIDLSAAPSLRGDHNLQNALAARTSCLRAGLCEAEITAGFNSFPGLAHRMQIVAERQGVLFVNDSKATNADAAEKSLSSFKRIRWIAGGLAKDGGIAGLRSLFGRVVKAYLIGESAPQFAATLGDDVDYEISGTLEAAVGHAADEAQDGDVVLLAPAAASFDQFANFEKRGEAFEAACRALPPKPFRESA